MRVYVPATWPMLRTMVKNGVLEPIGGTAFALTPKLRESYTGGDEEELEYAAMNEAARAALRLLSVEFGLGEDSTPARRVVVAADLEDVTLRPDLDDGAVRISGPVPVSAIAAVHVDVEEAEYAVRQAAGPSTPPTWRPRRGVPRRRGRGPRAGLVRPGEIAFLVELG
jgi:hypothetical protein